MITLQNLFTLLATGDLSHTKLGDSGTIQEEDWQTIVTQVNLGLTELHTRFVLKKYELQLQQHSDVTHYFLTSEHIGEADNLDDFSYILFNEDIPLEDNILKILFIFDSLGNELLINDRTQDNPIICSTPTLLQMDPFDPPELLNIVYQANHPKIVITDKFDPAKVGLDIPDWLLPALCYYIASGVYRGINSSVTEGTVNPAVTYAQQYELACQKLMVSQMSLTNDDTNYRFQRNGWI